MLHVYAIVDRPEVPLPDLGVPSLSIIAGPGAALIGRRVDQPLTATAPAVQGHGAVIDALMTDRTVLPVRFGSCLPDAPSATALLRDHRAAIAAGLRDVAGCVEVGLHLVPTGDGDVPGRDAPDPAPAASGRAHLARKRRDAAAQRTRRADFDAAVDRIHERLAPHTRRTRRTTGADGVGDLAFLVTAMRLPAFVAAVRSLRPQCPEAIMLCTGPWPAYSFVDLDLTAAPRQSTDDG